MSKAVLVVVWLGMGVMTYAGQVWTDTKGRELKADFVAATAESVTLKLANGKERTLPLKVFSASSRDAIVTLRDADAFGTEEPAAPAVAAVADSATMTRKARRAKRLGGGMLKTYSLKNAELSIGANGSAYLKLIPSDGSPALAPAIIEPNLRYDAGGKNKRKEFDKVVGEPKLTDTGGFVEIEYKQGGRVAIHYSVNAGKLKVWYVHTQTGGSHPTVGHSLSVRMPEVAEWDLAVEGFRSPRFPKPLSQAQLEGQFGGKAVVARSLEGATDRYPFPQKVDKGSYRGERSLITASAGVYADKGVRFDGPPQDATMHLLFYNGVTPIDGYAVVLENNDPENGTPRSAITITVE